MAWSSFHGTVDVAQTLITVFFRELSQTVVVLGIRFRVEYASQPFYRSWAKSYVVVLLLLLLFVGITLLLARCQSRLLLLIPL